MDDMQQILCYSNPFLVFNQKQEEIKDIFIMFFLLNSQHGIMQYTFERLKIRHI